MDKQIKTIDVDQIWRYGGDQNACINYKLYAKVNRKYIKPIVNDIENIEYSLRGKKLFNSHYLGNKNKIYNILDLVDRSFNNDDLKELLEKELSLIEFIYKVYAIRKRNAGELT
jgi:hypothetical protein|tara:strand:+ start:205 stop:546 length:342 start_codon:yes stop_codon:yes gene_type:complete